MSEKSTKSSDRVFISYATTTNAASLPLSTTINHIGGVKAVAPERVADAVYAYLQARRALGATNVSTSEVATALRMPQHIIDAAVVKLTDRGVKVG